MKRNLKFPEYLNWWQYVLIFPIAGLYDICSDIKEQTLLDFIGLWTLYSILVLIWTLVICGIGYFIKFSCCNSSIPMIIILCIIFLLIGMPIIIYKIANRKPRK